MKVFCTIAYFSNLGKSGPQEAILDIKDLTDQVWNATLCCKENIERRGGNLALKMKYPLMMTYINNMNWHPGYTDYSPYIYISTDQPSEAISYLNRDNSNKFTNLLLLHLNTHPISVQVQFQVQFSNCFTMSFNKFYGIDQILLQPIIFLYTNRLTQLISCLDIKSPFKKNLHRNWST